MFMSFAYGLVPSDCREGWNLIFNLLNHHKNHNLFFPKLSYSFLDIHVNKVAT